MTSKSPNSLSDKPDAPANPDPLQDDKLRDSQGREIETVKLTPAEEAARKRRNVAIAFGLVAFIALIFLVTVVRMTSNYNAGG